MIRLEPADFQGKQLRRLAETAGLDPEQFAQRFGCVVA